MISRSDVRPPAGARNADRERRPAVRGRGRTHLARRRRGVTTRGGRQSPPSTASSGAEPIRPGRGSAIGPGRHGAPDDPYCRRPGRSRVRAERRREQIAASGRCWASPCCRAGRADRRVLHAAGRRSGRSPTSRSTSWRPSPTRRPSPSRTRGCSPSCKPRTPTSRWPSSSRRPRARSCASSPALRPTSSRSSTRSSGARCGCARLFSALFQYDGELIDQVASTTSTPSSRKLRRSIPRPAGGRLRPGHLERAIVHIPDVETGPDTSTGADPRRRDAQRPVRPDVARRGADRRHHLWRARPGGSRTTRSSCSRPSPTRPSSPSRTSACSRSWRRATPSCGSRSSSRRPPPTSSG